MTDTSHQMYRDCPDCEIRKLDRGGEVVTTVSKCDAHSGLKWLRTDRSTDPSRIDGTDVSAGLATGIVAYGLLQMGGYPMSATIAFFASPFVATLLVFYLRGGQLNGGEQDR
ncbi:hypothetical protein [Natrinema sp. DC36]|uniref:hypothetical protein n=1 Tax=Natrinema sp. DC36 TaxID=2878680 RepID=UPI001CF0B564|nr:hypothetical protein [Natrinema sp. DC36]